MNVYFRNGKKIIIFPRNCFMLNSKLMFSNLLQMYNSSICFDVSLLTTFKGLLHYNQFSVGKCGHCLEDNCGQSPCISNCFTSEFSTPCTCDFQSSESNRKNALSHQILRRRKRDTTSACSPNPCSNNGVCTPIGNGYQCQCTSAYTGPTCSLDVNECLLNVCKLSIGCVNSIGSYQCTCIPGFQGVNCDTKINTCSPSPCQNNVMCYDMLNDYECLSSLTVNLFYGKNSTLPLTGCGTTNPCANNQQCVPVYNGAQTYQCACMPGLTGANCASNITFTLQSGMNYNKVFSGLTDLNVSFSLMTTNPNGLLTVFSFNTVNFYIGVDIINHGIRVSSTNDKKLVIPYGSVTLSPSQYVPYRLIMSVRTVSSFNVLCLYVRVGTLPQGYYCSVIGTNLISGTLYLNQGDDLKINPTMSQSFSQIPDMQGCIIDYNVNSVVDFLTQYNAGSACIGPLNPCQSTSCSLNLNRGAQCIASWLSKTCICNRPYFGSNCEFEISNLTLSLGSFMQLGYPIEFQQDLVNRFQVSFFFITSSANAVLFYIGSFYDSTNPNGAVFLSGELVKGYINVKSKLSGSTTTENLAFSSSLSWLVNDGLPRLLAISVVSNTVTVTVTLFGVTRSVIALSVTNTISFVNNFSPSLIASLSQVNIMAFGYSQSSSFSSIETLISPFVDVGPAFLVTVPVSSSLPPSAFSSTSISFVGKVQDIQWNGFMTNIASQANLPATVLVPINSQGLITVNVNLNSLCSPNPCQNGATCTVQNYNQMTCTCQSTFFGNLCQYFNRCSNFTICSSSTVCVPRSDGYDCSKIFSIVNNNQIVTMNVLYPSTQFSSISMRLRTRAVSSSLVQLNTGTFNVILEIDNQGKLVGRYASALNVVFPTKVVSNQTINDALWHTISFTFSPLMQIIVDQQINRASDYGSLTMGPIIGVSSVIFGDSLNSLLGCFDQPLIGQYLLVTNETASYNSSLVGTGGSLSVIGTCIGMDLCSQGPCKNNGICVDNFNQFSCICTTKFDGPICTVPTCLSLGACTINSLGPCAKLCPGNTFCGPNELRYGCQCVNGWIGQTCNIVNPCIFGANTTSQNPLTLPTNATNPCQNNGNCSYTIYEATNSSSFSCQCVIPWGGVICTVRVPQSAAVVAGIVAAVIVVLMIILTIIWVWKAYHDQKTSGRFETDEPIDSNLETPIFQKPPAEKII